MRKLLISRFDPWKSPLCTCPPKFSFSPYTGCDHACLYCYAQSYIPRFHDCRPKKNLLKRLEKEARKLRGEIISISNSSDPYPCLEAKLGLTRKCLQILANSNCKIHIVTKSTIVTRDIDLLKQAKAIVTFTITTLDETLAKKLEPNAPSPKARLHALVELSNYGIPTTARIDPIILYLNENATQLIEELAAAGVKHITASTYKAKPLDWKKLTKVFPETMRKLYPLYYIKGKRIQRYRYLPQTKRYEIFEHLKKQTIKQGLTFATCREGFLKLNTATCDGTHLLQNSNFH